MGCDCGIRHSVSFARLCKPGVRRALFHTCHLGEKASRDHLLRSMQPTKWVAAAGVIEAVIARDEVPV
jgi:hypothetical protein